MVTSHICPVLGRPDGYGGSDHRLKSGCWHTHRLRVGEIRPVRYVVLSGDILWLTVLQLEQAGYVVHGVLSNFFQTMRFFQVLVVQGN